MMRLIWAVQTCLAIALTALLSTTLAAQSASGQADLDRAVEMKLFSSEQGELDRVVALCETALAKGLDEENQVLARRVLASTLYQHGEVLSRPVLNDRSLDHRARFLTRQALLKLRQAVEVNDRQSNAFYLIARLESLPGGDRKRAEEAVEKAIEQAQGLSQVARVLAVEGDLLSDDRHKLSKYNEALQINPECNEALRSRGLFFLEHDENEKAIADFESLQKNDRSNLDACYGLITALTNSKRYDAAMQQMRLANEIAPDHTLNFTLHARLFALQGKTDEAIKVLGKALSVDPDDEAALLMRAQLRLSQNSPQEARQDFDRAMEPQLRPVLAMLTPMPGTAEGSQEKLASAPASQPQTPIPNNENETDLRIQLASEYVADKRSWKAIVVFTQILREEPENIDALSGRAEMRVKVGQAKQAVEDFEEVLYLEPRNVTAMNGLARVLATSVDAEARSARRSISLSRRACQLTRYQEADKLSTLAAGYAEAGDFDSAVQWAQRALELDEDPATNKQLRKELASYEERTPWRDPPQTESNSKSSNSDRNYFDRNLR